MIIVMRTGTIGLQRALRHLLVEVGLSVLGDIAVVITLHLKVEDLRLRVRGLLDQLLVEEVEDVSAVVGQHDLELLLVVPDKVKVARVLALFFLWRRSG